MPGLTTAIPAYREAAPAVADFRRRVGRRFASLLEEPQARPVAARRFPSRAGAAPPGAPAAPTGAGGDAPGAAAPRREARGFTWATAPPAEDAVAAAPVELPVSATRRVAALLRPELSGHL